MRNFSLGMVCLASFISGCTSSSSLDAPAPLESDTHAHSIGMQESEIDQLIARVRDQFSIPGVAVGVIKNGEILHLKGYGVRSIHSGKRVTSDTLFSIASLSKSFTATALAILVDRSELSWDDKVQDIVPEFELMNPEASKSITVKDLLIHNSGFKRGTGDLMFWPQTDFSKTEIVQNLRYLPPAHDFREKYAYSNVMYIVADEVVRVKTGLSIDRFIEDNILSSLGLSGCVADRSLLSGATNVAFPHALVRGKLTTVPRIQPYTEPMVIAGAGGLECSAGGVLQWLGFNLEPGKAHNKHVISEGAHKSILLPQIDRPVTKTDRAWLGTKSKHYGLGWSIYDAYDQTWITHAGALQGMTSYMGMIPETRTGVVVLTNQESSAGVRAAFFSLMEAFSSPHRAQWVKRYKEIDQENEISKVVDYAKLKPISPNEDSKAIIGSYVDAWFGTVHIVEEQGDLRFMALRSPRLVGIMLPLGYDRYLVKWDDRTLKADAIIKFDKDHQRFTIAPALGMTDPVFNFTDLRFSRVGVAKP